MNNAIVSSGLQDLDQLLGGGIYIGDNVVWYDDAGMLATVFCLRLLQISVQEKKHIIYVSFDRSPKSLLQRFESLETSPHVTILDCFTNGKGESSQVFTDFYDKKHAKKDTACQIICVEDPTHPKSVTDIFYHLHEKMSGDVRFVFDSLTGMQELWGGEESIVKFYSHTCPRLYELNTIAYWIVEKDAHSRRLRALLNQVTQVAIELSLKRGKTFLSVLKADKRDIDILNQPTLYWASGLSVTFNLTKTNRGPLEMGKRLKDLRIKRRMSQAELASQVGVTPSTISQVENNQIYPSVPALIRIAEILSVDPGYFFQTNIQDRNNILFHEYEAQATTFLGQSAKMAIARRILPDHMETDFIPFVIEIKPGGFVKDHFFPNTGEGIGFLMEGELLWTIDQEKITMENGDLIYLTPDMHMECHNRGQRIAKLFWVICRSRNAS